MAVHARLPVVVADTNLFVVLLYRISALSKNYPTQGGRFLRRCPLVLFVVLEAKSLLVVAKTVVTVVGSVVVVPERATVV
jgi:hypothetical protein